jgi:hypothetical protein
MDMSISGYDAIHYSIATVITGLAIVIDILRAKRPGSSRSKT